MERLDVTSEEIVKRKKLFQTLWDNRKPKSPELVGLIIPGRGSYYIEKDLAVQIFTDYYDLSKRCAVLADASFQTSVNTRSGLYLDGDIFFKPTFVNESSDDSSLVYDIAHNYIKQYLDEIGRISELPESVSGNTICHAYLFKRPKKEYKRDRDAYKSGFHMYFNSLSFSKEVKTLAYKNLIENIRGTALFDALDLPTTGTIKEQLDDQPLNGVATVPMSAKPNGLAYEFYRKLSITIRNRKNGFEVINVKQVENAEFTLNDFLSSIPSLDYARIRVHSSEDLVEIITPSNEIIQQSIDNTYDDLLEFAKEQSSKAMLILKLLELLPPIYATEHLNRIRIANLLYYDLGEKWARDILKWFYNSITNGVKGDDAHITERITDAKRNGKRCGIAWLKRVALDVNRDKANDIINTYSKIEISDIIRAEINKHPFAKKASHGCIAEALYAVCGENYHVIYQKSTASTRQNYKYYYYTEDGDPGVRYKKWMALQDIMPKAMESIEQRLIPMIDSLILDADTQFRKLGESDKSKKNRLQNALTYLHNTGMALRNNSYLLGVINMFVIPIAQKSEKVRFDQKLDQDLRYTGCFNGIIKADMKTGNVELLDKDNRDIFVSKSLGCKYNTELTDDSPVVKELMGYWTDIIPNRELLEHHLMMRAASFLGGQGGKILEIEIGTGADGKTTINNGEDWALGQGRRGSEEDTMYAATMKPQILQSLNKDGNSHDGGLTNAIGARKITAAEPGERNKNLDGAAIKQLLSGSAMPVRKPHGTTDTIILKALITLQTNVPLKLEDINMGSIRRIHIIPFETKFWDENTKEEFSGLKNAKKGSSFLGDVRIKETDIAEAHLYYWVKYLKIFVQKYHGDVGEIPVPARIKDLTRGIVYISDPMSRFIKERLIFDKTSTETIPLPEIIRLFGQWSENKGMRILQANDIMHKIASSTLQKFIIDKDNNALTPITIMQSSQQDLSVIKYRIKTDTTLASTEVE